MMKVGELTGKNVSPKMLAANRSNGRKSRGPVTALGKDPWSSIGERGSEPSRGRRSMSAARPMQVRLRTPQNHRAMRSRPCKNKNPYERTR
jgi:hypothetical protein